MLDFRYQTVPAIFSPGARRQLGFPREFFRGFVVCCRIEDIPVLRSTRQAGELVPETPYERSVIFFRQEPLPLGLLGLLRLAEYLYQSFPWLALAIPLVPLGRLGVAVASRTYSV